MERQGETARAEKLLRDAIRMLRQIGPPRHARRGAARAGRAAAPRGQGRGGRAVRAGGPRGAHAARHHLAHHHDAPRSRSSARLRAATRRPRRSSATQSSCSSETEWRSMQRKPLRAFARFLTELGRADEARPYEERLAELDVLAHGSARPSAARRRSPASRSSGRAAAPPSPPGATPRRATR